MKKMYSRLEWIKRSVSRLTGEDKSRIRILKDHKGEFFLYCGSLKSHDKFWSYVTDQLERYDDDYSEYQKLLKKHRGTHECQVAPTFKTVGDLLNFMEEVLLKVSLK